MKVAVVLGVLFLAAACQDGSRPVAPSFTASSSSLPHINITELPLPVSVNAALTVTDCSNNPGPNITLDGVVTLGGFGVEMTFSNTLKDAQDFTVDRQVDIALQSVGVTIRIPKQPVLVGAGGNPFISVQFVNAAGTPTSDEIFLGRCVQGGRFGFNHAEVTTGSAFAEFGITGCENSLGPFISMDASLAYEGLSVLVIFRNNDNPVGGPHEATRSLPLSIIPPALSFTFPKQPVEGGVGDNPWILAGFLDGAGTKVSDATLLGRCVPLSQALS